MAAKVNSSHRHVRRWRLAPLCFLVPSLAMAIAGCKKSSKPSPSSPATTQSAESQTPSENRKYELKGTVLSVNSSAKSANIDSEAIPGFMDAMAMDYDVHTPADLAKLKPNEKITADLIVTSNGAYIENVAVVGEIATPEKP